MLGLGTVVGECWFGRSCVGVLLIDQLFPRFLARLLSTTCRNRGDRFLDFLTFGRTDEPDSGRMLRVVKAFGSSQFQFRSGRKLKVGQLTGRIFRWDSLGGFVGDNSSSSGLHVGNCY